MVRKDAEMIAVYGMRGMGKTTRVREIIAVCPRVLVFDPHQEYGFSPVRNLKSLRDRMAESWSDFRLSYVPPEGDEVAALSRLSEFLFRACEPYFRGRDGRQMTLVVEEIQQSFPNEKLPAGMRGFEVMCQRGRHRGINVIGVTQQPATVSTRFRGNCVETHIFNLDWHTDVQAVGAMIGPANAKKIRGLGVHESYIYRRGELSFRKNAIA